MTDQYEHKAKDWDEVPWKIDLARDTYSAICSKVNIHPDAHLVDLGGGTGLLTLKFLDSVSRITVVDTSQAMLAVLREKIKAEHLTNVNIIEETLDTGTLPTDSCDVIISMLTLHHIDYVADLFQHLYAALVPGGKIALVDLVTEDGDFHPADAQYVHNGFEPQILETLLENTGFENIAIDVFASVTREMDSGGTKAFPLFLITAEKGYVAAGGMGVRDTGQRPGWFVRHSLRRCLGNRFRHFRRSLRHRW